MPSVKPLNVLVYSGSGTTVESVRHCLYTLRLLLSPNFAVYSVTSDVLLTEPWMATCALLVIPGGADLPYCKTFAGVGTRKISQYVRTGGLYIGFCAGGYFASRRCEFEVGNGRLEVVGSRELGFFPGTCRGAAFSGFRYESEDGARAPRVCVAAVEETESFVFRSYFNGGGVFVDAGKYKDKGVEVLATYEDELDVDGGMGKAAVVYCKYGDGAAILTGPHPEFVGTFLHKDNGGANYAELIDAIVEDNDLRIKFMKMILRKLGLRVSETAVQLPSLSRIHLTSMDPPDVGHLVDRLEDIITVDKETSIHKILGGCDTIIVENAIIGTSSFSTTQMAEALSPPHDSEDYNKTVKYLQVHSSRLPDLKETPFFDHTFFYHSLATYRKTSNFGGSEFGTFMMYGETVTSTNTTLNKNPELLYRLPNGLTFTATAQVDGRGRGSNIWISPKGCMVFSTVIHHSQATSVHAPVSFVQYIIALAIVEGIKNYDIGYRDLDVRLKWPNDIYARDTSVVGSTPSYVKIGGILVNSSYSGSHFHLVVGAGINLNNSAPTTSLSQLLAAYNAKSRHRPLPQFRVERLLARILVTFEEMYYIFCSIGFSGSRLERLYYQHWLHTDQIVSLGIHGGVKAKLKGIEKESGLLVVVEEGTGKVVTLQPDGNSFDFFSGLIKRKE